MQETNWHEIYSTFSPKLLGICRRYIKDLATAEDILQDSFIVAIQKEHTLKDPKAINGWLSRIVINMAINHLKETKKINFSTSDGYDLVDNSTIMNTLELDNKSALLASDINQNDILEAIDCLSEHHKSVFNMYVIDQFSHNEIAQTLAISVGTSKSSLSRARKAIQYYLFEKLKDKNVDKEKKRRIALLLLFGFENSMFANFYQSKFKNFEIVTRKPFLSSSKKVAAPHQFVGLSKAFTVSKIAVFSIGFLSLIGVSFYFLNANSTKNEIIIEKKLRKNTNQSIATKIDSIKTKKELPKSIAEKEVSKKIISTKKEKNTIPNSVAKRGEKISVATKKDSAKAEKPKVVVVKKQIIKRDTIYVTK
jgi:RNA polymerase sigma factor (sigma-70 family)